MRKCPLVLLDRALGKDARRTLSTTTPMADTPEEHVPCTDVETDRQENRVDGSLILAEFPSELLVHLAETLGNPLALLVSKAHLSKDCWGGEILNIS